MACSNKRQPWIWRICPRGWRLAPPSRGLPLRVPRSCSGYSAKNAGGRPYRSLASWSRSAVGPIPARIRCEQPCGIGDHRVLARAAQDFRAHGRRSVAPTGGAFSAAAHRAMRLPGCIGMVGITSPCGCTPRSAFWSSPSRQPSADQQYRSGWRPAGPRVVASRGLGRRK